MSWISKGLDAVFGKKDTQTTQRSVDPRQWAAWNALNQNAQQAGQAPMDPRIAQAGGFYQDAMGRANLGMGALSGDASAQRQLMNPFQQNVLNQIQGQYGRLNAMAQMGVNDQFTRAGAFGGSRQGVASGVASGEIARGLGEQMAGLQYQGFNDAMNRAGMLSNLGMGAAQGAAGIGQYWQDRPYGLLANAYGMIPQGGFSEKRVQTGRPSIWDTVTGTIAKFTNPTGAAA